MRQTDKEYAEALLMLASEEGICEPCLEDLKVVREVLSGTPEYLELLVSPAISQEEKLSAIDEAFGGRVCDYVVYFLKLLCEKGRIRLVLDVINEYEKLAVALIKVRSAVVTSAAELSDDQKKALVAKLEGKVGGRVSAEYFVDPSLIGGLRIEIDGRVYDGTLKGRLRDVKEVIKG